MDVFLDSGYLVAFVFQISLYLVVIISRIWIIAFV